MKKIRYVGKIPVTILGIGDFSPGDEKSIRDEIALELANDPNWILIEKEKPAAGDSQKPGRIPVKGGK